MTDFGITVETRNFNEHIRQFTRKSNKSIGLVIKKFAFDLLKRIIKKTPVDTGRARGAWYVAFQKLGGEGSSISMPSDKPRKSGKHRTYAAGVQEGMDKGSFIDNTQHLTDKWFEIINGVDYIIYLEYGSSDQAPYGMIRLSMRELRKGQLPSEMSEQLQKDWNSYY